ncbi:hypothetical protein [Phenylobacterium sp.]|uniref:hypothetical protein n=1 Tax=Phenylobacterium sp. TaxID=1871053 RepID=UPI0035B28B33
MAWRYFQVELGRARAAQAELAAFLRRTDGPLAVWAPVLGFASNTALVLLPPDHRTDVLGAPGVVGGGAHDLEPTLRPTAAEPPPAGGIYVHNWFTVDAEGADEFVRLSGEAWPDFETRFEARIYGLFLAAESEADLAAGQRRLLLMTRYRDLGEWQKSRDPTTDAWATFLRRRELTRVSLARACALIP